MLVAFANSKIVGPKTNLCSGDSNEKRGEPRKEALDISEILVGASMHGYTCMVHDISDQGAKLEVTTKDLPDRFILANHIKRTRTLCRVMWRNGNFLGVRFVSRPRPFTIKDSN